MKQNDKTIKKTMETILCTFRAQVDGDGYLDWEFLFATKTVDRAIELISELPDNGRQLGNYQPVHGRFTPENNYTILGSRSEVPPGILVENPWNAIGYIIEICDLK